MSAPMDAHRYSLKGAVSRLVKVLGTAAVAREAVVFDRFADIWSDPDNNAFPGIDKAVQLDRAFVAGGYGDPPILSAMQQILGQTAPGASILTSTGLVEKLLEAGHRLGLLQGDVMRVCPPEGVGPIRISESDRQALLARIAEVERSLDLVRRALTADH